jgi:hypothetical protein
MVLIIKIFQLHVLCIIKGERPITRSDELFCFNVLLKRLIKELNIINP